MGAGKNREKEKEKEENLEHIRLPPVSRPDMGHSEH